MFEASLDVALPQEASLGEALQWQAGRWWWTDIEAARLHAWSPGAQPDRWDMPDRVGCFAHARSGRVLIGMAKRLALVSLASGVDHIVELAPVDAAEPRTRVNDGRTDRSGRFVFGTMNEAADKRPIGSFYQYSVEGGLRRLSLPTVSIANSICFSVDGRTMYFCDTLTQCIWQCDYDSDTAQVSRLRRFADMGQSHAWPDGSVIDADGCLWNAQWGAGRVRRYAPDGQVIADFALDAAHAACPAFGGDAMDWLMVSTARTELSRERLLQQPLSGSLFGMRMPRGLGVPDALFNDDAVSP
jgi:sugar lactone lactonase YvrE